MCIRDSPMTAERLLSMDSSISPAMAQWMEQSLRERAAKPGRLGELSMEFTGVTSLAQLEALTEADATARWLEAHDPNHQYRLILRSLACTPPLTDSERQSAPFTLTTLGVVTVDDDDTGFVLTAEEVRRQRDKVGNSERVPTGSCVG